MALLGRFLFPSGAAALRRYVVPPAFAGPLRSLTAPSAVTRSPELFPFGRRQLLAFSSAASKAAVKPAGDIPLLRLSQPRRGASLEDYYTNAHLATCIQSPWPFYMWMSWAFLMAVVSVGFVFQSNYYFSGRILPKPNSNTQLCEDSW